MDYWEVSDASSSISEQLEFINMFKLKELKGESYTDKVATLIMSEYVMRRNYDEIMNTIEEYEEHEIRKKEVLRTLHNYLSSVYTFIEHTHTLRNSINDEELEKKFKEQLEKNNLDKKSSLMKCLRNYTQHYSLPLIREWTNTRTVLDKESISNWGGSNEKDIEFLESYGHNVNLKYLLEDYQSTVESFYEQFYKLLAKSISNELVESELDKSYLNHEIERNSAKYVENEMTDKYIL